MVDDFMPRHRAGAGNPSGHRPAFRRRPSNIARFQPLRPSDTFQSQNSTTPPTAAHHAVPAPLAAGPAPAHEFHSQYTGQKSPKGRRRSFKEWLRSRTKKQWIIFSIILVLLIGGGVAAFVLLKEDKPAPKQQTPVQQKPKEPPKPITVPSNLTGLPVDPSVNDRPVTGVMIENSPASRPQSGLDQAGVIFEAVAEGGITRFLTLFQDQQPDYLGPVRSVRPYYLQWALGFDASVAHVGGSPEALQNIKQWGVKDLDQFQNSAYFTRISSRLAPHNVYTSIARLNEAEKARGYGKSNFTGFARKAEKPSATITARALDFTISSVQYNPHYDYDPATNTYKRSLAGQPHMDEKSGKQLAPKVVVVMVLTQTLQSDRIHYTYGTIGSGKTYVFQDGTITEGTWSKASNNAPLQFKNTDGTDLKLNPGQTWISAVNSPDRVKYAP